MAKNEIGCFLNAPWTILEVMPRHASHGMMHRVRKGHGGDLIPGPLKRRTKPHPVRHPQVARMLRHPALPQTQIAAKFFSGAMIGLRQSPVPAGQKLIACRWRPTRQGLERHPNAAAGWRGMFQACFVQTGCQA